MMKFRLKLKCFLCKMLSLSDLEILVSFSTIVDLSLSPPLVAEISPPSIKRRNFMVIPFVVPEILGGILDAIKLSEKADAINR